MNKNDCENENTITMESVLADFSERSMGIIPKKIETDEEVVKQRLIQSNQCYTCDNSIETEYRFGRSGYKGSKHSGHYVLYCPRCRQLKLVFDSMFMRKTMRKFRIFANQNGECYRCQKAFQGGGDIMICIHLTPIAEGGDGVDNQRCLCRGCYQECRNN